MSTLLLRIRMCTHTSISIPTVLLGLCVGPRSPPLTEMRKSIKDHKITTIHTTNISKVSNGV